MPGIELKRQDGQVIITPEQAYAVLVFFFGADKVPPAQQLKSGDISYAQALLIEGIDKSYAMGFVQDMYGSFYGKVPTPEKWKDLLKDFGKKASRRWFDHAVGKDLSNPKIYASVRNQIIADQRSTWESRDDNGVSY